MKEMDNEAIDSQALERLWQHRQYLTTDFINFSNFFLIAQSIILSVYASIDASETETHFLKEILQCVGLITSTLWILIQTKQLTLINQIKRLCEKHMPEYKLVRDSRKSLGWPFSNMLLLAVGLPGIFVFIWVIILLN